MGPGKVFQVEQRAQRAGTKGRHLDLHGGPGDEFALVVSEPKYLDEFEPIPQLSQPAHLQSEGPCWKGPIGHSRPRLKDSGDAPIRVRA